MLYSLKTTIEFSIISLSRPYKYQLFANIYTCNYLHYSKEVTILIICYKHSFTNFNTGSPALEVPHETLKQPILTSPNGPFCDGSEPHASPSSISELSYFSHTVLDTR